MSNMNPEQLFEEITRFITESHALLEQGAFVELAGLDGRVKSLCESVLALSQEDRTRYADKLQQVFDDLGKLEQTMIKYREALSKDILSVSEHRKATVAYRTAETSDNKKPGDE